MRFLHNFAVGGVYAVALFIAAPLLTLVVIGYASDRALTWIGRLLDELSGFPR